MTQRSIFGNDNKKEIKENQLDLMVLKEDKPFRTDSAKKKER
jgi:hypothetical protein